MAHRLGYPVALMLDSEILSYHHENGTLGLNLTDDNAVCEAYHSLQGKASSLRDKAAKIIIQPVIEKGGIELSVGTKRSLNFGSVIIFGIGGDLREAEIDYSVGPRP